jgi:hypothetical protein
MDRIAIREMVEDAFRSQLLFQKNYIDAYPHSTPQESQDAAYEFVQRWAQRIEATADLMPPEQGAAFRDMVDEEYGFLGRELKRNPQAFAQRLGVATGRPTPQVAYQRQGIAEMAVRTAVRATVWELIWSLFRR